MGTSDLLQAPTGSATAASRQDNRIVLTTYGRSSGFCVDPIEKKPLNHFHPGSSILSFGTAGCNLACKFCQNWDISKSREIDTLADAASPQKIARVARTGPRR
jgi:pyruvate formate lyase activating enzyme